MKRKYWFMGWMMVGLLGLLAPLRAEHEGDRQPMPLAKIQPEYPKKLQKAGIEGGVIIEFIVDPSGNAVSFTVISSDHPKLDKLALAAIKRTKFLPGLKDGKPVKARCRQKVVFSLQD